MENSFSSPRNDTFPAGLRVLVVDDDSTWLKILEKMLKKCSYEGYHTQTHFVITAFCACAWVCCTNYSFCFSFFVSSFPVLELRSLYCHYCWFWGGFVQWWLTLNYFCENGIGSAFISTFGLNNIIKFLGGSYLGTLWTIRIQFICF